MKNERWQPIVTGLAISAACIALAVMHMAKPHVAIDGVTLGLLGVAAAPWLGSIFESFKLPWLEATYRDRLAKVEQRVAEFDRAIIRGGDASLQARLAWHLDEFANFLRSIGLDPGDQKPTLVLGSAHEGMATSYDLSAFTISIDEEIIGDPSATLHEYSHLALLQCTPAFKGGGPLTALEGALADYLTCSFKDSPRVLDDSPAVRRLGLDAYNLDHENQTGDLADPVNYVGREMAWAQVFWRVRATGSPREIDAAMVSAWRTAAAAEGAGEDVFVDTLAQELQSLGDGQPAATLTRLIAERGL